MTLVLIQAEIELESLESICLPRVIFSETSIESLHETLEIFFFSQGSFD